MRTLYSQKGAQFEVTIMEEEGVQDYIHTHARTLDHSFQTTEMSPLMRQRLQRSNYVFSGIKAFHQLGEAFPSLLTPDGQRKPFEQFLQEVRAIDQTYNLHYLRTEYNFAQSSALMAAKWERMMKDGTRYNLQYRTAGDNRVRPTHAAMEGITLPINSPFWQHFYPPNGWNCRCTVQQVRKSKYTETPLEEAIALGELATQTDKTGIFHFNSGQAQQVFPDYNPYTIQQCRTCPVVKDRTPNDSTLARGNKVPLTQLCQACQLIRQCNKKNEKTERAKERAHYMATMEPLLSKKVDKPTRDKRIKVGFNKRGNKHLFADTFGRTRWLQKDDLKNLDQILQQAEYESEAPSRPGHNNPYERFYYYKATIHGHKVILNVGMIEERIDGRTMRSYILYSVSDCK